MMIKKLIKRVAVPLVLATLYNQAEAANITPSKEHFSCSERVTAYFEIESIDKPRFVTISWIRPDGKTQENTVVEVTNYSNEKIKGMVFLDLFRSPGTGIFNAFDSSLGFADFIGPWDVELRIKGKKKAQTKIIIEC